MKRVCTSVLAVALLFVIPTTGVSQAATQHHHHHHHHCEGKRATIVGTKKHNTLIGTNHADVIWAGGGNDFVAGRGGVDIICGGKGSDTLDGNVGIDHLNGGHGYDWCLATSEREHMHHHRDCEVHELTQAHKPKKRPHTGKAASRLVPEVGTRASQCGSQCYPGRPVCGGDFSSKIDWRNPATLPQGTIVNNGYLAVAYQFWTPRPGTESGWAITYSSGWAYTAYLSPGTYNLQPTPIATGVANGPGTPDQGYVMVWFAYSPTGSAGTWSFSWDLATSYLFDGTFYQGTTFPTGECSV